MSNTSSKSLNPFSHTTPYNGKSGIANPVEYFFILLWVYLLVPLYEVYIKRKTLDDQLPIILGLEHGSQCSWGGSVPVFAETPEGKTVVVGAIACTGADPVQDERACDKALTQAGFTKRKDERGLFLARKKLIQIRISFQ